LEFDRRKISLGRAVPTVKYDPFGMRIQKVYATGSTTTKTNYLYDGDNDVEEVNASGSILARYTQTQSIDEAEQSNDTVQSRIRSAESQSPAPKNARSR
jgi:hypothetical protein